MRKATKGFTLLEAMVAIAIIGILVALAVPAMVPMVRMKKMRNAAEVVASVLEDARRRAVNEGRCFRVTTPTASTIDLEERATVDCTNGLAGAFDTDGWKPAARTEDFAKEDLVGLTMAISDTAAVAPNADKIIFRPNSRLRGNGTLTNTIYGARVLISDVPSSGFAAVDVDRHGRICITLFKTAPGALTPPVVCP